VNVRQDNQSIETNSGRPLAAVILAAGKGTRMKSDLPKVAHEVNGRPMVWWVVEAVREAGAGPIVLIVGHGADLVRSIFEGCDDVLFAVQDEQLGTGHATNCAKGVLDGFVGDVLVLAGDGPLIRAETILSMRDRHVEAKAAGTLATSVVDDPTGYGRVIRTAEGRFQEIVEQKNATDEQKAVREIYPSYACFDTAKLFACLDALEPNELTGEYYVTDVPAMLVDRGDVVEVVDAVPPEDVLSINTPEQLADVDAVLRRRMEAAQR
jgi:bifunctional UDP-N-acetylglucosamine pyrophosphorylase/glucosamine-1-phosphate N-acetyltransferase